MKQARSIKFYAGLAIIGGLIFAVGLYAKQLPEKQAERGTWVTHTREVINAIDVLEMRFYEAQLAHHRNHSSTPVEPVLAEATPRILESIAHIEKLIHDNGTQRERIDALKLIKPLDRLDGEFANTIARMRQEEESLLAVRVAYWEDAVARSRMAIMLSLLVLFAVTAPVYVYLYDEVRRRQRVARSVKAEADRLGLIVGVQQKVATQDLDLETVMNMIVEQTRPLVRAEGSIIELLDGDEMVYTAAAGSGSPHIGLRIKAAGSLSGKSVQLNEVLVCDDSETDGRVDREACRRVGLRSMVVVPLLHQGKAVGVLKVMSSNKAAFTKEDVNALQLLTGLLSARMNDATAFKSITTEREELRSSNAQLTELASTDGLTGLRNHRSFKERLQEEFGRAKRYKNSFALLLMDVDHFKSYNDNFGHVAGDGALRGVAAALKRIARETDFVARYGGEEFAVILPETGAEGAMLIADRLRAGIESSKWELRQVTVSVGVGVFDAAMADPSTLVEATDDALYASKEGGRNRVTMMKAIEK